jgi:hypothetical protein
VSRKGDAKLLVEKSTDIQNCGSHFGRRVFCSTRESPQEVEKIIERRKAGEEENWQGLKLIEV